MNNNTVRTTFSIPKSVYRDLRELSFHNQLTFGEIVTLWREQAQTKKSKVNQKISTAAAFALFDKVAKSGKQIDLSQALQDQRRDRMNQIG